MQSCTSLDAFPGSCERAGAAQLLAGRGLGAQKGQQEQQLLVLGEGWHEGRRWGPGRSKAVPGHAGDKHLGAPEGTTEPQGKSLPALCVKHGAAFWPAWMCCGTFKACRTPCLPWELKESTPELPAPAPGTCLSTVFVPRFVSFHPACEVPGCWRALPFLQIGNRNFHLSLIYSLMRCSRWAAAFCLSDCQPSHSVLCFSWAPGHCVMPTC